jgi:hypothetical protein
MEAAQWECKKLKRGQQILKLLLPVGGIMDGFIGIHDAEVQMQEPFKGSRTTQWKSLTVVASAG